MKTAAKAKSPRREPAEQTPARTVRQRILLVDDDAGVRGSLQDVLVGEDYQVIPADDGLQALEIMASRAVDLVLLDLNMPRKNGWDTFERLSADHPLVPVVLITARPNQLFAAVNAGVGALLEKPLDFPVLLQTIDDLLAEPVETRIARLAGRDAPFCYGAGKTAQTSKHHGSPAPPK
jgi:CheY-like chemotaxis protein